MKYDTSTDISISDATDTVFIDFLSVCRSLRTGFIETQKLWTMFLAGNALVLKVNKLKNKYGSADSLFFLVHSFLC